MSEHDRRRWNGRYADGGMAPVSEHSPRPPPVFAPFEQLFPTEGHALDLACGRGRSAVWLASRGMEVWGVDVSPVAIGLARELASRYGVADRCRFEAVDLDDGLPEGPLVDLLLCHLFRDHRLDEAMIGRLAPGGLLAVVVRSEVGAGPAPFHARPGELRDAFGGLDVLTEGEDEGMAWILARRSM
ncbi:MAG: class I SAM-dependent methyltransferase [Euzebyales bacterium]|nr:class I SAM-dependent methyltransferase [Euzebyales bacterium]